MLTGLKTYAVVAVAIISAALGYFDGQLTLMQALQACGLAASLGGNRAVIKVGEVLNSPYRSAAGTLDPRMRQMVTYAGAALTILTAIIANLNGEQEPAVTIGVILAALGLNFLGLGAKKAVERV
jgi:hypothetical protein